MAGYGSDEVVEDSQYILVLFGVPLHAIDHVIPGSVRAMKVY